MVIIDEVVVDRGIHIAPELERVEFTDVEARGTRKHINRR
jgi:hypothetical protein